MLKMFKAKNFYSFKDEVILDMRAVSYKDMKSHVIDDEDNKVVKTLAIYGKNASGKSNLLKAMYYFKSFVLPERDNLYDVYFLGTDGGRRQQILDIYEQICQFGMRPDFHIFVSKVPEDMSDYQKCFITEKMGYQDNLKHIAESRAVLEILRPGQSGQTLRALECLFFKKKLITNDSRVKSYEFYHPDNIFILGENKIEDLPEFMEKKYVEIDETIVDKYDCKQWLERFFIL